MPSDDDARRVWVEDTDWRVPSDFERCRRRGCPNPPVADLARVEHRNIGGRGYARVMRWWAYCADHLYGRHVHDGKVLIAVAPGSAAAAKGHL